MKNERTQSYHKNLTYQDRLNIEERLKECYTFKAIADELGRIQEPFQKKYKEVILLEKRIKH